MQEKTILVRAVGIQKGNWGEAHIFFLKIIKQQFFFVLKNSKIQSNVWRFLFQINALLPLKNAWLTPQFSFWNYQEHLLSSVFSA